MIVEHTDDCSLMAWGYDPILTSESPYHGAYSAVVEGCSVCEGYARSFEALCWLTLWELDRL